MIFEVLLDSVIDTAKMLPFLFVAYLVIEAVERYKSDVIEKWLARGGRFGFVPGAALGCIPQCGFSAMAANFYSSGVVTLGTLLAVFIATSDEAIPILFTQPNHYSDMVKLILAKLGLALLIGFLIDVVFFKWIPETLRGGYKGYVEDVSCHAHDEEEPLLLATLKHTANIFLTVLIFTFLFGLLVNVVGEARISSFMGGLGILQPVVAGLFGLIPNCASSVLLTQLFLSGTISFGSVLAGLSTNAGIGLTVLFKTNKNIKQNLFIVGLLFCIGTIFGMIAHGIGL